MLLQFSTIIFLIIMLAAFQLSPGNVRRYVLLLGSIVYISYEGGLIGLLAVLAVTLVSWGAGMLFFSGEKSCKRPAAAVIVLLAVILFSWKYIPWLLTRQGYDLSEVKLAAVPIGLSFYTFQAISYIADLYTGKLAPEKSLLKYAIYMTWFPKWMSGPIERAGSFIDQLKYSGKIRAYSFRRITAAAPYLIWGLVMKLMIADKIAAPVDAVFADVPAMGAVTLILASVLYTIQIYCDFAGYTNIAIGISKLFGLDLTQNFKTPYMAENIVDFWRRWHISLSNFLRDYVYIPLGGNRKGAVRKHLNTVIVFFICGLWHGAGLSFIVWGMIHAILNILTSVIKKTPLRFLTRGVMGRVLTFAAVSFAWIFFRSDSLSQAFAFIRGMIPAMNSNGLLGGMEAAEGMVLGMGLADRWVAAVSILVLVILDVCSYVRETIPPQLMIEKLSDNKRIVILAAVLSLVLIFGEYGAGDEIRKFVYMNF